MRSQQTLSRVAAYFAEEVAASTITAATRSGIESIGT
jgi:hypothetical protein